MRYLGVILRKAVETNAEQEIIQAITIEIVARSFKAEVFQKMREIVSSCASEDIDIECKRAAARSLNALLSHGFYTPLANTIKCLFSLTTHQ